MVFINEFDNSMANINGKVQINYFSLNKIQQ